MSTGIYLDNAATTYPKPDTVYAAVDRFQRDCGGSPGRGSYGKAREAEEVVRQTRLALARLLRVQEPARIVFTSNATESLNLALHGWLGRGDQVLLSDLEHNAVVRPLWKLAASHGVETVILPSDPEGFVEPDAVERAITPRTRLICCTHVNNVLGTIQPVAAIGAIARRHRIPFLVDASQSAGIVPIDVNAMGIDLLACTGHKGLLGPPGTGALFVREGLAIEPLKYGGTGIRSESLEPPEVVPDSYETGTFNAPGLAGLRAGLEFIEAVGPDRIRAHECRLNARFMEGVQKLPGIRLFGPPTAEHKVGITLLQVGALDPADVGSLLDRRFSVMVRSGLHCSALTHRKLGTAHKGAVRFSFGYFTTLEHVEAALAALQSLTNALGRRPS